MKVTPITTAFYFKGMEVRRVQKLGIEVFKTLTSLTVREKFPNTESLLVRIFLYSN